MLQLLRSINDESGEVPCSSPEKAPIKKYATNKRLSMSDEHVFSTMLAEDESISTDTPARLSTVSKRTNPFSTPSPSYENRKDDKTPVEPGTSHSRDMRVMQRQLVLSPSNDLRQSTPTSAPVSPVQPRDSEPSFWRRASLSPRRSPTSSSTTLDLSSPTSPFLEPHRIDTSSKQGMDVIVLKDSDTESIGMHLKLHDKYGIMIAEVDPGGAADRSGMIRTGDVIDEINGKAISKEFDVAMARDLLDVPMSEIHVRVSTPNLYRKIVVSRQHSHLGRGRSSTAHHNAGLGFSMVVDEAVGVLRVASVVPGGNADVAGLCIGDRIVGINGTSVIGGNATVQSSPNKSTGRARASMAKMLLSPAAFAVPSTTSQLSPFKTPSTPLSPHASLEDSTGNVTLEIIEDLSDITRTSSGPWYNAADPNDLLNSLKALSALRRAPSTPLPRRRQQSIQSQPSTPQSETSVSQSCSPTSLPFQLSAGTPAVEHPSRGASEDPDLSSEWLQETDFRGPIPQELAFAGAGNCTNREEICFTQKQTNRRVSFENIDQPHVLNCSLDQQSDSVRNSLSRLSVVDLIDKVTFLQHQIKHMSSDLIKELLARDDLDFERERVQSRLEGVCQRQKARDILMSDKSGTAVGKRSHSKHIRRGAKTHHLKPGKSIAFAVPIASAGCFVRWRFTLQNSTIGFGVFQKDVPRSTNTRNWRCVEPMCNLNMGCASGFFPCDRIGEYAVVLNNAESQETCITQLIIDVFQSDVAYNAQHTPQPDVEPPRTLCTFDSPERVCSKFVTPPSTPPTPPPQISPLHCHSHEQPDHGVSTEFMNTFWDFFAVQTLDSGQVAFSHRVEQASV
eukprot:m.9911 g.9911  ORF g.9911 m.9911 type:complete len:845 (+) comp7071_c0_seq1:181-2715(+)